MTANDTTMLQGDTLADCRRMAVQTADMPPAPPAGAADSDGARRARLLEAQAMRIVDLQTEISQRQEELDELKRQILDACAPGTYPAGALKVTVKRGASRLDAKRLEKDYPAASYPQLYASRLDVKLVRAAFAPVALEAYQTAGSPQVTVS